MSVLLTDSFWTKNEVMTQMIPIIAIYPTSISLASLWASVVYLVTCYHTKVIYGEDVLSGGFIDIRDRILIPNMTIVLRVGLLISRYILHCIDFWGS